MSDTKNKIFALHPPESDYLHETYIGRTHARVGKLTHNHSSTSYLGILSVPLSMTSANAEEIAKAAKSSFESAQLIPSSERINALHAIKAELDSRKGEILAANKEDLQVGIAAED